MGWNDHIGDVPDAYIVCPNCNKKYRQWTEDQVAGCRSKDADICPYCGKINGTSMEVEYHNSKIDE